MEYQMIRLGLSDSTHMPGIPGFTPDFGRSLKPFFSEFLGRTFNPSDLRRYMFKGLFIALTGFTLLAGVVAFPVWLTHGFSEAVAAALAPDADDQ